MRIAGTLTRLAGAPKPGSRLYKAATWASAANVHVYRITGGLVGGRFDGAPVLLLHHVGARSGQRRVTPLLYLDASDKVVIVASMGGSPKHPAWFHNLRAHPDTVVEIGRETWPVRARVADAPERAELWPRVVELYPAYQDYQDRSRGREIPLVVLEGR